MYQGVRVLDPFAIKGSESLTHLEDMDSAIKGSESLTHLEDMDSDPLTHLKDTDSDPLSGPHD